MDKLVQNFFNLSVIEGALPSVLIGFATTVQVALAVIAIGVVLGLGLALLRLLELRALDVLITAWIELFRTLPQLVIIIFLYFALPYGGIRMSPFAATAFALGSVLSAFCAEIFTASIAALPKGQWEAARALNLPPIRTLRLVILPQAVRLATPLITNRVIAVTKGSALGVAVSLNDTLGAAQSYMAIVANPSPLMLAAALYLAFFIPLVTLSRYLERRMTPY
ncbi:ABC transporter permease subunit [Aurantimonas sp. 22II-16-19i]|uniref:amino acid ABC transporter permease n=1 Tax=Aurantimonas sp. 22II-16-19i TaxID=1317114 RepID=UPI0009F7FB35|nr:ABC transporter permease subunit [Aurantimonas sp. 22II-16-19i]ORE95134.1 glutamine ABC transporter membrane protein [Aurantimonas sp. 22II-16-19i]